MQASARGLNDIGLAKVHVKAIGDALVAGRNADAGEVFQRPRGVVMKDAVLLVGEAENLVHPRVSGLDAVQHLAKGKVALAADEEVPQTRVLTAGNGL